MNVPDQVKSMHKILLSHGRIVNPCNSPPLMDDGYILIADEKIVEVGRGIPGAKVTWDQEVNLGGKTVLPGMINAHHHLYSSLALGMPPPAEPARNFTEILSSIWWKLDLALDEESTLASFESGCLDALKAGVTTVIDHHSSQNTISGSLGKLVETAQRFGITISPSFEITDRNGRKRFDDALRENLDTYAKYHDVPGVHPMIGLHASFTLSDESLTVIRESLRGLSDWGIHIHVAEDQADQADARQRGYSSVVQRLRAHNLVNEHCLFIHGLYMQPEDIGILQDAGVALVHNPTSNANNRVGLLPTEIIENLKFGLGTDGMQANMLREAKEGTLIRSSHLPGGTLNVNYAALLFENNPTIASRLFGCKLGSISPGYQADLAIYDYQPTTEMNASNIYSHILFGLENPTDVLTRGKFRIRDNEFVDLPEEEMKAQARLESGRLWRKMQEI